MVDEIAEFFKEIYDGLDGWAVLAHFPGGKFGAEGGLNREVWFRASDAEGMATWSRQHADWDVYFSPFTYREKKRRKATVLGTRAVYADLDDCQPGKLRLEPTLLWETSPKRHHALWLMTDHMTPEEAQELAHGVAVAHRGDGCDQGGWDISQLLRVPGTSHNKREPFRIQMPQLGQTTTVDAFVDFYEGVISGQQESGPVDPDAREDVPDLPRHILRKLEVRTAKDRSEASWDLISACGEWGLSDGQILAVLDLHRPTQEKLLQNPAWKPHLVNSVAKVRAKHPHAGSKCDEVSCMNTPAWMKSTEVYDVEEFEAIVLDDVETEIAEKPVLRIVQDDGKEVVEEPSRIPESFWGLTPALQRIQQAAQARRASPDAVLHAVLARVAACLDSTVRVDTRSGPPVTLGWYAGLYGPSGTGKGKAESTARELLPFPDLDIAHIDFSTGQGVIAAYLEMQEVPDATGDDTVRRPVQVRDRGYALATEGSILETMARSREGGTLNGVLCKAWTSERQGTSNADMERRRSLDDGSYVLSMSLGVQLDPAIGLLAMGAIGLPQRLAWAHAALDPETTPERRPGMPGGLTLTVSDGSDIPTAEWLAKRSNETLEMPDEAAEAIDGIILANAFGRGADNPLDTHEPLWKAKVSALLALLHGWTSVQAEHWNMAGVLWTASRGVRVSVEESARKRSEEKERRDREAAAKTGAAVAQAAYRVEHGISPVVFQTAQALGRKVHRDGEMSLNDARKAVVTSRRRKLHGGKPGELATESFSYAEEAGWVVVTDKLVSPGKVDPK